jgi:chromosomal replication initiator protein
VNKSVNTVNFSNKNINKSWVDVLEFISPKVGDEAIDTWFQPLELEGITEDQVTIRVPNKFFGEWLGRNYKDLLLEAFHHTEGVKPTDIIFVLKEGRDKHPLQAVEPVKKEGYRLPQISKGRRQPLPNPKYTFNTFVVGASNQFAHAACLAVAESPAKSYNPLFIYGGIAYVTTEQFTNEVINSIRYDKMMELRRRYRNVDMLLIDDIQFLAGKERTQEEFFHTFNSLYEAGKQIVLSSDRFPKEMPSMEERLRSRFEWGLIADLQQPDVETRIAILRKKSEEEGIAINEDVIQLLAANLKSNIREIEGALIRLGAYASLTGQQITVEMAKNILRDLLGGKRKVITAEDIQEAVASRFHVKISDLKSKRRTKTLTLVYPRQIAMFLCRNLTDASFPEIGRDFGGKDHTTIIHACKQMKKSQETDATLRATLESLKEEIGKA